LRKKISILGSTGSIGINTLKVVDNLKTHFQILGLASFQNIDLLEDQVKKFKPRAIAVVKEEKAQIIKERLRNILEVEVYSGISGVCKIATLEEVDIVVSSIVGSGGLLPTIEAIKSKKDIALANKEVLVMAGEIVMKLVEDKKVKLIPIDSEHSAIFQCLRGQNIEEIKRLILTASGGPFREREKDFDSITPKEAVNHPRWRMGKKISVDSATLINKGLEIIEATHLFGIEADRIEVIIHPESIVHSLVEFIDGTILAQLGITDMQIPIAFALSYPYRYESRLPSLSLSEIRKLSFFEPDLEKFPSLRIAREVAKVKGSLPCVLNASNEICVEEFLEGRINFKEIVKVIEEVLAQHKVIKNPDLEDILKCDLWAKEKTREVIKRIKER
jgi:1-deoxy-D-xylulose-5-phosphate reductoisomerase